MRARASLQNAKRLSYCCARLAEIGCQIAEMRDQGADVAVVLAQEGDELVALFQRQPDAREGEIHHHRLAGIGAHPEIHFQRRLAGMSLGSISWVCDDEVGGRALGRAGHLQGLAGIFGEIGLIDRDRIILERGDRRRRHRPAAALRRYWPRVNIGDAASCRSGPAGSLRTGRGAARWKAACCSGSPGPCGCCRPRSSPPTLARGGGGRTGQHQRRGNTIAKKGAALEGRRKRHHDSFLAGRMFAVCYGKFKAPSAVKLSQKSGKSWRFGLCRCGFVRPAAGDRGCAGEA